MAKQELWGYLLTHYAISALTAPPPPPPPPAPAPTRSSSREPSGSSAAGSPTRPFPPDDRDRAMTAVMADITDRRNLNQRRERTYPRVVKRARHNAYRVKKPGDHGTRHHAPPTIKLANPVNLQLAA